jgi:hypothetical protein
LLPARTRLSSLVQPPVERLWLFLHERHLSHRLLDTYDAIVDALCHALTALTARAVQRYAESVVSPGCNRFRQNGSGGRELGFPNRRNSDP